MVEFDLYTGPTIGNNLVPIPLITRNWKSGQQQCSRKKFPLQLSSAMTIHKAQGLTLDKAVVNIGEKELSLGITYVALSRVKTLKGLLFDKAYVFKRFQDLGKSRLLADRNEEERRMHQVQ